MQRIALFLLVFCAMVSGATVPFARLAVAMQPTATVAMHHDDCAGHAAGSVAADGKADCHHGAKPVHPLLCAACFAIVADAVQIPLRAVPDGRPEPGRQQALTDATPQPQSPPPKTRLL